MGFPLTNRFAIAFIIDSSAAVVSATTAAAASMNSRFRLFCDPGLLCCEPPEEEPPSPPSKPPLVDVELEPMFMERAWLRSIISSHTERTASRLMKFRVLDDCMFCDGGR